MQGLLIDLDLTEEQARRLRESIRRALEALGVQYGLPVMEAGERDLGPDYTEDEVEQAKKRVRRWLEEMGINPDEVEDGSTEVETEESRHLQEQFLTAPQRARLYDKVQAETEAAMARAAEQVIRGDLSPNQFQSEMDYQIKNAVLASYLAGKAAMGGGMALSAEERRDVRRLVNRQMSFLRRFVADVKAGRASPIQIRHRTGQYARGATAGPYEQGRANAYGRLDLPQVPRDGKTKCKMNCKCELEFEPIYQGGKVIAVKVYWRLRPAEHCDDCLALAGKWNPYRVEL